MTKPDLVDLLREVASSDKDRSETARLRDVFDEVEKALNAGARRQAVLEALHARGFTMSFYTFENAIYRIRKERAQAQARPATPETQNSAENP